MEYTVFKTKEERENFINLFVKNGFELVLPKDYIKKSPFPVSVDFEKKEIGCLTTASYAGIVAQNNLIVENEKLIEKLNLK